MQVRRLRRGRARRRQDRGVRRRRDDGRRELLGHRAPLATPPSCCRAAASPAWRRRRRSILQRRRLFCPPVEPHVVPADHLHGAPADGQQRGDTTTVTGDYFVAVYDKDYRCRFGGPTAEVDRQDARQHHDAPCMSPPRPWPGPDHRRRGDVHRLLDDARRCPLDRGRRRRRAQRHRGPKTDSTPGRWPSPSASNGSSSRLLLLTAEGSGGGGARRRRRCIFFGDSEGVAAGVASRTASPPPADAAVRAAAALRAEFTERTSTGYPLYAAARHRTYVEKPSSRTTACQSSRRRRRRRCAPTSSLWSIWTSMPTARCSKSTAWRLGRALPSRVAPAAVLAVGAAAATGADQKGDQHWVRLLHARGRRLPTMARVALAVSTNAQQYRPRRTR